MWWVTDKKASFVVVKIFSKKKFFENGIC